MTDSELVAHIKKLDAAAKKGPWYPQGHKSKDKTIYKVGPNEEALIIALRNHIGDLLRMIENK